MASNTFGLALFFALTASAVGAASDPGGNWLEVQFPHDSPVLPVSLSLQQPGPTTATVRGASLVVDLHASLLLRNTGTKTLSGLTLLVETPELTPSGRGSVTVPSLHAEPGEVFPVHINMQITRPLTMGRGKGAMMQLSLDCALFSDLTAYGPDKLQARRQLVVYELQARRDRRYLAGLLAAGKSSQLREELNFGLQDLNPAQLAFELLHGPGSSGTAAREQPVSVNTVAFPDAPLKPLAGRAEVTGNEIRSPRLELRNTSTRIVKNFEIGWIIRDDRGRDFMAGSVPSTLQVGPVETASLTQQGTFRFSHPTGQPMVVDGVVAFVNDVEFADGKLWIPSRRDITEATPDPVLRRLLSSSPEQQRLAEIYRRKGMVGLADELKRLD